MSLQQENKTSTFEANNMKTMENKCKTCKHCTDWNILFGCYQCELDWHDIKYTKSCSNFEKL